MKLELDSIESDKMWKFALFFAVGIAVGSLGAIALSRRKDDLASLAASLCQRGKEVKEALLTGIDAAKEKISPVE
ncbi:MAG: hypothetical protein IJU37_11055 [Desulfovibrio sp.]|nr:hypothetical protein [Desulfovibrio sp.]